MIDMYIINFLFKSSVILLISLLLASCKQEMTYEYLMLHPHVLEKEFAGCRRIDSTECDVVDRAAKDFNRFVDEQTNDPELFGQRIMQAQREVTRLLIEYEKTNQTQDVNKIKIAKQTYQDQLQNLRVLYAVAALRSPE